MSVGSAASRHTGPMPLAPSPGPAGPGVAMAPGSVLVNNGSDQRP